MEEEYEYANEFGKQGRKIREKKNSSSGGSNKCETRERKLLKVMEKEKEKPSQEGATGGREEMTSVI
jgi:hypothetical protein